ncbi:hypothetical protein Q9L58_002735 [Maublancomyces gigas]|uniref:Uncharacterized protein n=1 Tax=Discina gigas TaxID=1032678 RepID=A0ABR3GQS6_9PEZI
MASTLVPPRNAASWTGFMDSFQREFLNLMSFGYLDDSDNAGVFATDSTPSLGPGGISNTAGETAANVAAAGKPAIREGIGAARGLGNVFTYVTSPWAVMCLFMAIILNRTMIYASLRRPLRLPFRIRLALRLAPILLSLWHVCGLLLAMRCQSSGIYKRPESSGLLYNVGFAGTWWLDDRQVCEAAGMIPNRAWVDNVVEWGGLSPPENAGKGVKELPPPRGSLELLWPLYKTLCLSQFVEIFACAITGRSPATETGMTLLEHSLAFAEAEVQAKRKAFVIRTAPDDDDEDDGEVTKSDEQKAEEQVVKIYSDKNVPPEVLYIGIVSALGHLTSHVLGVFGLQARYRLLSTGFFGIAFLSGFAWALRRGGSAGVLDFPTVCVVGFIPHLLIFTGITFCAGIYAFALIMSSLFPPPPSPARPSFKRGFENLRANLTLSSATINMSEDFYTTLLKLGFLCLTAASEATYLNEGRSVRVPAWTWLESQKAKMLDSQQRMGMGIIDASKIPESGQGKGPYARERKDVKGLIGAKKAVNGGKWGGAGELMRGVGVVAVRCTASCMWRLFGIRRRTEAAQQQVIEGVFPDEAEAEDRDDSGVLYSRFLRGQLCSEIDESGDYDPDACDDDDTATVTTDSDWESDYGSRYGSRQTTPTPETPRPHRHRTPPSLAEIFNTPHELASFLDPQTPEQRDQARVLARHLTSTSILTRSGYERTLEADRALLHPGQDEERTLESVLLRRRRERRLKDGERYDEGEEEEDEDEGGGGPQCVVCQSAPRTILGVPSPEQFCKLRHLSQSARGV